MIRSQSEKLFAGALKYIPGGVNSPVQMEHDSLARRFSQNSGFIFMRDKSIKASHVKPSG